MRNLRNFLFASLIVSLMIAAPINYVLWNDKQYRNFHVVEEGVLYRSAQLPLPNLERVVIDHHIRTVVCLRDRNDAADQQEAAWVKAKGLNFVRIQPHPWFPDAAGNIPAEKTAKEFLAVMADPANYPVLVHCYAGIHRTGMMCALYRMDFQGWTSAQAEAEMRLMGYSMLDDHEDVLTYLARRQLSQDREKVHTVYVPMPRNVSRMPNFEFDLETAVLSELKRRPGVPRLTTDRNRADTVLEIKIVDGKKSTVLINELGETRDLGLGIQIELVWRDRRPERRSDNPSNRKLIFPRENPLHGEPSLPVIPYVFTPTSRHSPEPGASDNAASARDAARQIVNLMEAWP